MASKGSDSTPTITMKMTPEIHTTQNKWSMTAGCRLSANFFDNSGGFEMIQRGGSVFYFCSLQECSDHRSHHLIEENMCQLRVQQRLELKCQHEMQCTRACIWRISCSKVPCRIQQIKETVVYTNRLQQMKCFLNWLNFGSAIRSCAPFVLISTHFSNSTLKNRQRGWLTQMGSSQI